MEAITRNLLAGALASVCITGVASADPVTGTVRLYDPAGFEFPFPMPQSVTGTYDPATNRISVDPWFFLGFSLASDIQLLGPGTHSLPDGVIVVGAGQEGGDITNQWSANTIPSAIVWDVTVLGSSRHLEPVDSDGDGIPGHRMTQGPFPGFTLVYELDIGQPFPDVDVTLDIPGGGYQECDQPGGKSVALDAQIDLIGGATLDSIIWTIDGAAAGTGPSISPFLSLGNHTIQVTASTTAGTSDTESTTVVVRDTVPPDLDIRFVDTATGMPVTEVTEAGVSFIEVQLGATDACDEAPVVNGVAKPVTALMGGEIIKIKTLKQEAELPATAIEVTGFAEDASGNRSSEQSVLKINP